MKLRHGFKLWTLKQYIKIINIWGKFCDVVCTCVWETERIWQNECLYNYYLTIK
jgi:hypothetical protein